MKLLKVLGLAALPVAALSLSSCGSNVEVQHATTVNADVVYVLNYGFATDANAAARMTAVTTAINEAVTEAANDDLDLATDLTGTYLAAQNTAISNIVRGELNGFLAGNTTFGTNALDITVSVVAPTGTDASDYDFRVVIDADFANVNATTVDNAVVALLDYGFATDANAAAKNAVVVAAINTAVNAIAAPTQANVAAAVLNVLNTFVESTDSDEAIIAANIVVVFTTANTIAAGRTLTITVNAAPAA